VGCSISRVEYLRSLKIFLVAEVVLQTSKGHIESGRGQHATWYAIGTTGIRIRARPAVIAGIPAIEQGSQSLCVANVLLMCC